MDYALWGEIIYMIVQNKQIRLEKRVSIQQIIGGNGFSEMTCKLRPHN